jgi:hypothetical protein
VNSISIYKLHRFYLPKCCDYSIKIHHIVS